MDTHGHSDGDEAHSPHRHSAVPRARLHLVGARLCRVSGYGSSRHHRIPDLPTPLRCGPNRGNRERVTPLLLPAQLVYLPRQAVLVETFHPGSLVITRLGETMCEVRCERPGLIDLGELSVGGHGVARPATDTLSTLQVCVSTLDRLRYGFIASFRPGKDAKTMTRFARRLHSIGVQLYSWAYRRVDLLSGEEECLDTPSQPISLATVCALIGALRAANTRPIGHVAVYSIGNDK